MLQPPSARTGFVMDRWFSSPARSLVTAVVIASAFGVIITLIAALER